MKNATKKTQNAIKNASKTKHCENCETLKAQIAKLTAPKPYTIKLGENGEKSNAYLLAEAVGLIEKDAESATFPNRKEYNKLFNEAMLQPEAIKNLVKLYCAQNWSLEVLEKKLEEAKERKAETYRAYVEARDICKGLTVVHKAVKKAGMNAEQFQTFLGLAFKD